MELFGRVDGWEGGGGGGATAAVERLRDEQENGQAVDRIFRFADARQAAVS